MIGVHGQDGYLIGPAQLVDRAGTTLATGNVELGAMEGYWDFYDSRKTLIAEVRYYKGAANGQYRTYFGSQYHPAMAGKLQSEGYLNNGREDGKLTCYNPDGSVLSSAYMNILGVKKVLSGPATAPARIAANDERFIAALTDTVVSNLR